MRSVTCSRAARSRSDGGDLRRRLPRAGRLPAGLVAAFAALAAAAGDVRWLAEGLADSALWDTPRELSLLGRNEGDPAGEGALRLWAGIEPHPRIHLVVLGELEAASGRRRETEIEQALVRVALRADRRLQLEAGRLGPNLGDFARRYLPDTNPLVGRPIDYDTGYPLGIRLSGVAGWLDYRVALVDEPLTNERYLPAPDTAIRPAVSFGLTPFTGFRVGAYHTAGPYLSREVTAGRLDPGVAWDDLEQRASGVEIQWSRGHHELHADWSDVAYDAPPAGRREHGELWFVEGRRSFTPRLFAALRYEHARYVGVSWLEESFFEGWFITKPTFSVLEAGAGWRVAPSTILKSSVAIERWHGRTAMYYDEGTAVAFQLVQRFDVLGWFERPR